MTAIAAVVGDGAEAGAVLAMLDAAAHRGVHPALWRAGPAILGYRASRRRDGIARSPHASSPDGFAVVFDGRLDNADELRRELGAAAAADDAALVLAAYAKWSDDTAVHLLGDFAFVVWDGRRRRLLGARDAMGQRPLFFAAHDGRTLVASEPQEILAHPGFPAVANEGIVAEYLSGNPATIDEIIWSGITRLPPGHALLVSDAGVRTWRFWDFDRQSRLEYARDEDYADHFLSLLRTCTECRMRGAAAVGVFLSGGLDSSVIAACADEIARARGVGPVRAFSLTFPGLPLDETPFIDAVVDKWQLPSIRMPGRAATRDEVEADVARFRDLPAFPNGSVLDPLRVRAAAEVDVVLSGAGGDDWFTGSPVHTADLLREGRLVAAARQYRHDLGLPRYGYTPARLLRMAIGPLLPRTARAILRPFFGTTPPACGWIRPEFARRVGLEDRLRWPGFTRCRTLVQSEMYLLANTLIQMVGEELEDRATSAAGLENSNPFYDRRMVEFGFALPETQRWRDGETKFVMRRACASMLPAIVRQRDDKAEFSPVFVQALAELGGAPFFKGLETAKTGWVDEAVAVGMYANMTHLYARGDAAYIPLVFALWAVASVELWLRRQRGDFGDTPAR